MAYQRKLPILSTLHLLPDAVLNDLEQHSSAPPPINWQKFARDHNVPGDNCVKEFAEKSGDGRQPGSKRKRHLCRGTCTCPTNCEKNSGIMDRTSPNRRNVTLLSLYSCVIQCLQWWFGEVSFKINQTTNHQTGHRWRHREHVQGWTIFEAECRI